MKSTIIITTVSMGMFLGLWTALAETPKPDSAPTTKPVSGPGAPAKPEPTSKPVWKSKVPRPTVAIAKKGCVTPDCHVNVKQYKVLHGPVNVNACDACHKVESVKKHTFKMTREKETFCKFCHKQKKQPGPVVHKPVRTGDCLPCHNPHGGTNKRFLRGKSMKDFCKKCHKKGMDDKKVVHGPVAAGACGACHKPHDSKYPKLLVATGRDLCFGCHAEMKKQMSKAKFTHKAMMGEAPGKGKPKVDVKVEEKGKKKTDMKKDCMACHDAHGSNYAKQIRMPGVELCTTKCHQKIKAEAIDAPKKHSVVLKGKACLSCHTAHGGGLAKLMRATPIKICMNCHSKKIEAGKDRVIAAVPEVLAKNYFKHGPIRKGNCTGCHTVHGGKYPYFLSGIHPETFYESFEVERYGLCFKCHNPQLALTKNTDKMTNFRNGLTNLHYLHVNKARKGRTCRACHSTHASTNPMHVRESVPYGNWKMPISFVRSKTGGSCAAGCHKELAYDRVKAIPLKDQKETDIRAGMPPPAPKKPVVPTTDVPKTPAVDKVEKPGTRQPAIPDWLKELKNNPPKPDPKTGGPKPVEAKGNNP